jgi:hypothetical protein
LSKTTVNPLRKEKTLSYNWTLRQKVLAIVSLCDMIQGKEAEISKK